MPEGFKAQVVATSSRAAVTYREKLLAARDEFLRRMEAVPTDMSSLPEDEIERSLTAKAKFLVIVSTPRLSSIPAPEVAVVISRHYIYPESWWDWLNKEKQKEYTKRFKRKLATAGTDKTDPLALTVG